jgi:curved DNA-binding protein CbpA
MAVMDMDGPATKDDIKERYKTLVKKNHPDTHRGDRKAEERLKIINRAYSTLMACDEI